MTSRSCLLRRLHCARLNARTRRENYSIKGLQALLPAGERCDPDPLLWAQEHRDVPVIDHCWRTETGWPSCTNCLGLRPLPIVPGSSSRPVPGFDMQILDDHGDRLPVGRVGALVIKQPLPPGTFIMLWNASER